MMSPDGNTPTRETGKNGKAKPPARRAAKRGRKIVQQETAQQEPAQQQPPQQQPALQETAQQEPAQQQPALQEIAQQAAPEAEQVEQPREPVAVATENPLVETTPNAPATAAPVEPAEAAPAERTETSPVSLQTITNAYGDFTRKSIEQTTSFFEQLAGVRSFSRVFELQGEFARQSCETFIAESRKIRELHSELTMQRLHNLESYVARMKPTRSS